jgi:hypothetical protein
MAGTNDPAKREFSTNNNVGAIMACGRMAHECTIVDDIDGRDDARQLGDRTTPDDTRGASHSSRPTTEEWVRRDVVRWTARIERDSRLETSTRLDECQGDETRRDKAFVSSFQ